MSSGRPVARLIEPFMWRAALLIGVMALIAVAGIALSTRAVDQLSSGLLPASSANQRVVVDLAQMQAGVEAWVSGGHADGKDDYRQAAARLEGDLRSLSTLTAEDAELATLVTRQEDVARRWLRDYAQGAIESDGGSPLPDAQYARGQDLFAAIMAAHEATTTALDARVRQARADEAVLLRGTILGVLLLAVLTWLMMRRTRSRMLQQLSAPLLALEEVVTRLARGDQTARASGTTGPREIRSVAVALNQLADEQTQAKAVEKRLQTQLRTLDSARDDFVSNVSHELRTPLTTIRGYLEMAVEEFEDRMEPRHERMVDAARRNVQRLGDLIDDILALSKAENRSTDLRTCDLGQVVSEVVTDVKITAAGRGIGVSLELPERRLLVLGDRSQLHRAFLNVVSNAVKFSRPDSTVEVRVTPLHEHVVVSVSDHGIGIPAAELERLGSRFFRASNAVTNEIAGTGLGIRIVQTIIDKHHGLVRIDSVENEGTTVSIRLDLQAGSTGDPASGADADAPVAGEPGPGPEDEAPALPARGVVRRLRPVSDPSSDRA